MKKKFFIGLFFVATIGLFIFAHIALSHSEKSYMQEESKQSLPAPMEIDAKEFISYEEGLKSEKPMITMFYVDWCMACIRFMPTFIQYAGEYSDKYNFSIVNCEKEPKLAEKYGIVGYPTLYLVDKKLDFEYAMNPMVMFEKNNFEKELKRYLSLRKKALK